MSLWPKSFDAADRAALPMAIVGCGLFVAAVFCASGLLVVGGAWLLRLCGVI